MNSAAEFFELLGYVLEAEEARTKQEAKLRHDFAAMWWDIGLHIANKPKRRKEAAKRREKSRGSWNKS
jgi:hypothetical protein